MPRAAVDDNDRMNLQVRSQVKARLVRAAALHHTDLTDFGIRTALKEADAVIAEAEQLKPTERDSRLVLDLLENPPPPNARLPAALAGLAAKP